MVSSRVMKMQPMQMLKMQPTTALKMRPTQALMMQHARTLMMKPTQTLRVQPTQSLGMRPTRPMMRPSPKEEHSAHTISQRLRTLKKIPIELLPLGVVLLAAIVAATYSLINKLFSDKTLRLTKSNRSDTFK